MTEKMPSGHVQSRQAVFMRCCLKQKVFTIPINGIFIPLSVTREGRIKVSVMNGQINACLITAETQTPPYINSDVRLKINIVTFRR